MLASFHLALTLYTCLKYEAKFSCSAAKCCSSTNTRAHYQQNSVKRQMTEKSELERLGCHILKNSSKSKLANLGNTSAP